MSDSVPVTGIFKITFKYVNMSEIQELDTDVEGRYRFIATLITYV